MKKKKDVNLSVQINDNIFIEFSHRYPKTAKVVLISAIISIVVGSIKIYDYLVNVIHPSKIYLSLYETGKEVELKKAIQTVPPINPIKENVPTILRFKLEQYNTNSPEITRISLSFPKDVIEKSIKSLPADGWEWQRGNDTAIIYFLNYPTDDPPAKGSNYCLPALEATFKSTKDLIFTYKIDANKMNPINRTFKIDPNYSELTPTTFTTTFRLYDNGCNSNSVTPVASGSICIPSTPIKENIIKTEIPTVSPDTGIIVERSK